jgi:hypothetical protein
MENRKLEQKSLEENVSHSIRRSATGPIDRPLIKEIAAQGKITTHLTSGRSEECNEITTAMAKQLCRINHQRLNPR